jgi:hypothetical protein
MGPQINDRFRNLTPEQCRELARREPALRAAASRWLFTALVSSLRRAVEWRIVGRRLPDADRADAPRNAHFSRLIGRSWDRLRDVKVARPRAAARELSERQLADIGSAPRSQLDPERIDRRMRLLALGACLSGGWFFWDTPEHAAASHLGRNQHAPEAPQEPVDFSR